MDYISRKWPIGSSKTSICHQRMWFILGLMGADTSLQIHTDVWWKWRAFITRAEWLLILITCSLYTVSCRDGAELISQWTGSRTLARPFTYEKSHISLCHASREFTLWNPSLHFITLTSICAHQSGKSTLLSFLLRGHVCCCCHAHSRTLLAKWSKF